MIMISINAKKIYENHNSNSYNGAATFSVTTLSIKTLSIMTFSITISKLRHSA